MIKALAWVFVGLAAATAAFHAALIAGAPWGHLTMGGQWPGVLPAPARGMALASGLVMALMAAVVAVRAGLLSWPLPRWTIWVVVVLMTLSVILHLATPSGAERALWLPVVSLMAAVAWAVALG